MNEKTVEVIEGNGMTEELRQKPTRATVVATIAFVSAIVIAVVGLGDPALRVEALVLAGALITSAIWLLVE